MLTDVLQLGTDNRFSYSLAPAEAVIAAYEQHDRGNYNTWTYLPPDKHPQLRYGKSGYTVHCGDFSAMTTAWHERRRQPDYSVDGLSIATKARLMYDYLYHTYDDPIFRREQIQELAEWLASVDGAPECHTLMELIDCHIDANEE
jgi:hypothetical protein